MTDTPFDESASPPEPEEPPAETSPSSTSVSASRRSSDGEAADSPEPPSEPRRARWLVAVLAAGLVVVLAAVGLVGTRIIGVWGPDPDPTPEASASPEPTEPPSPFDGTPAENFAEGAAGIVLPEAEAVGDFTADEVAEALEQVRAALIAARLDSSMLVDHRPRHFLQLLAPDHRPGRRAELKSGEFSAYATQVADNVALAAVPPRVEGDISYEVTTAELDLPLIEVVTRFVWVYAFEASADSGDGVVVVRDEVVWQVRGEPWLESSRGLWLSNEGSQVWSADCDAYKEGLLRPDGALDDAKTDVIFDPEQPLDPDDTC